MAGPEAVSSSDSLGVQKAPPSSIEAEEALLGSALLYSFSFLLLFDGELLFVVFFFM